MSSMSRSTQRYPMPGLLFRKGRVFGGVLLFLTQGCSLGATSLAGTPAQRASEISAILAASTSFARELSGPICIEKTLEASIAIPGGKQDDLRVAVDSFAPLNAEQAAQTRVLTDEELRTHVSPQALGEVCEGRTLAEFSRVQFRGDQAFTFMRHFGPCSHGGVMYRLARTDEGWRVSETVPVGGGDHSPDCDRSQLSTYRNAILTNGAAS